MQEKEKWLESVKSIGSIYRDVFNELEKEGKEHLMGKVMFEKGLKAGKKFREKAVKGGKENIGSLKEVARALIELYETYNIKASIKEESAERVVLSIENCEWGKLENWSAKHCASIEQYERGLIEGINAKYTHKCPGRKSLGDMSCEVVVELKQN